MDPMDQWAFQGQLEKVDRKVVKGPLENEVTLVFQDQLDQKVSEGMQVLLATLVQKVKKETEDHMANAEKEAPLVRTVETGLLG